jgi:prepilin peptidase CpaA
LGAGVYVLLHFMGGMGMGDVKLVAAIGAWIGPSQLLFAMLLTGFAGGVMAVGWAVCGGFAGDLFRSTGDIFVNIGRRGLQPHPEIQLSNERSHKLPYAPAIAVGTLISFFSI